MKYTPPKIAGRARLDRLADLGESGKDWYTFANAQIKAGAVILDIEEQRFADLLALFSPQVAVIRSVRFAVNYVRRFYDPHEAWYLSDVTRGVRAAVDHYERTGEIRGPKTSAFAKALMLDGDAIVLDTWMAKAFKLDAKRYESAYVRKPCEDAIKRLAKRRGWTPAQAQAAVWTGTVIDAGRNPAQLFIEPELDNVPI